jgi:hypothetical protein
MTDPKIWPGKNIHRERQRKVTHERLKNIAQAILSNDPLSAFERRVAHRVLLSFAEESLAQRERGRPPGTKSSTQARVALALMSRFDVTQKEAVAAAIDRGTARDHERVARMLRKALAAGEGLIDVEESEVEAAASRLGVGNKPR